MVFNSPWTFKDILQWIVIFAMAIACSDAHARTDFNVINSFYSPSGCPIEVTEVESHWQDYRPGQYNAFGSVLIKELPEGIWCKVHFDILDDENAKKIIGVKFGIWYFNAFDELIDIQTGLSSDEIYKPGKSYVSEWTTEYSGGETHYRTIVFPYQIRFENGEYWKVDFNEIANWFWEEMESGTQYEIGDLFPNEKFPEFYETAS